ncbi:MAG: TonB-dependent receptor [Flavobacteriaceae bacterium]|nr:TonB-dependent receptor [Flavobacteriaceae bacterium]
MKKTLLFCIVLITGSVVTAQKITILDRESEFPIPNVAIINEDMSKRVVSDSNGIADLSLFLENEILTFKHVSYVEFEALKRQLIKAKFVYLQSRSEQLDEVFLSASKGKESLKRIAEQIAVFSSKDIQQSSPQTSADLLAEIPGIKVQKSQLGGGSPVLRGMEANRVLLVVDGVRMNNAIYRKGHLQNSITVSPNMLDRTEVIFGPSSVIYGSDALGGVIHYYTRKPMISEQGKVNASFLSRYSTVNNEKTIQGGIELQFKKLASFTSVSYSYFGDLRMGEKRSHGFDDWGLITEYSNNTGSFFNENPVSNSNPLIQRNTGYNQTDILQKFFIPLTKKTELTFNFQYTSSSDIPRFDRLIERSDGELRFAEWYYGPQERMLLSSQILINPDKKWIKNGTITAAYQNIEESRINRKFGSLDRITRIEKVDVFSLNGDFSVPLSDANSRVLSYGVELTHNDVNSTPKGETLEVNGNDIIGISAEFPVQSRYADGGSTYTSIAAYLNYRQDINERSTLNTGIRFTDTYLSAKWIENTFITLPDNDIYLANSAFTATLGYVYKPTEDWQLNAVLSSGFRSPNIDDIGKVRERRGDVTVPNVSLRPEYAYNVELGMVRGFKEKSSYIGLTGYYTLLNNYIIRENFMLNGSSTIFFDGEEGNIVANVNRGNAYVFGGTLNMKSRLGNYISAKASATYTKGKAYDTGEPLSSIPPFFGQAEFNYLKNKLEAGMSIRYNGRKKTKLYNTTEGIDRIELTPEIDPSAIDVRDRYYGVPSWVSLNTRLSYRLTRNINLQVALDNIFDQHYIEFASGISAPGRNLSVSILANF